MTPRLEIGRRPVGPEHPPYVVAELSANHGQSYRQAADLVRAAAVAGADAVKLQTYTPDTLTLDCAAPPFQIRETIWAGRTLHELYREAYTPWEWHPRLRDVAGECGLELFSSPFDPTAVDFLERMGVPAYKIASFELVDVPLLRYVARTGKPVLLSTGMATDEEIALALATLQQGGSGPVVLLKCTSSYPAAAEDMNLRAIPRMRERFGVPVGLSDHSLDPAVAVTAVALGACVVEKHFTLSRSIPGPDSSFSLEPDEFAAMVQALRTAHAALGDAAAPLAPGELASRRFRRSLFAVEDIRAGERFTPQNVRSIRPADGLPPVHLDDVLGRVARVDVPRGTPLEWRHVAGAN